MQLQFDNRVILVQVELLIYLYNSIRYSMLITNYTVRWVDELCFVLFFCMFFMCVCQVRTKTVPQCVEYYYLSKKLHDKQEKEKAEERQECDLEQQTRVSWAHFRFSASLVWVFPFLALPFCFLLFHRDCARCSHFLQAVLLCSTMLEIWGIESNIS